MIPLVDAYLRKLVLSKITFLRSRIELVDKIFGTLGTRTNLDRFKEFVATTEFRVIIGYPQEPQQIPCYCITLLAEQEEPVGLGDAIDNFEMPWDDNEPTTQYVLTGVYTHVKYRIECWSTNGDLTAYMYTLLKWCLLSARKEMLIADFILPKVSGLDLEPVPNYMQQFVYRRPLVIEFSYLNKFFEDEVLIGDGLGHLYRGTTIDDVNITNKVDI